MKKFIQYGRLAILFILVFSSCSGRKKPIPQARNSSESAKDLGWDGENYIPEEGASLKIWFDNEDMSEAIVAEWQKAYPAIPLEYEIIGSVETRTKMTLDAPAGLGADVFIQPHDGILPAYQDGILLPLGEYSDRIAAEFNEQASQISIIDNNQYAIPWSLENIAFFWNKDLVEGEPPETWEELVAFAKEYNEPETNKWAIRWEVNNSYMDYFFLTAYGFRLFGPDSTDADNPGWDSPEVLAGLTYFQSLRDIFDVSADDASGEYTVNEFVKGTVPFTITGPWSIQQYKEAGLNFGVTKLPLLPGNRQPYTFSGTKLIHVSSYTKYPNAARRLAMFLTEDAVLAKLYSITGNLPAKKDTNSIAGVRDDPYLKGILAQSPYSYPMPTIAEMSFAWEPQRILFYYTWNRELTPAEAIKKAEEDYNTQRISSAQ